MKLVVTGANGYIGCRLVALATAHGHEVVVASRRRVSNAAWLPFELTDVDAFVLPVDTDAVIHLAAQTYVSGAMDEQIEVVAAKGLIAQGATVGSRLIFVSSQTARVDAPTAYGRIKWQIEQLFIAAGGVVVRPGQVYGADERGLFGTLVELVRRLPVLPAFLPAPLIQPIHVDDLALGLLRLTSAGVAQSGVVQLGAERPVTFTRFLQQIGKVRVRRPRLFIPVPVKVLGICRLFVSTRVWRRLGLNRLDSLFTLSPMSSAADIERLQLVLRPLSSGMSSSGDGNRRGLLQEGRVLLRYLLKQPPKTDLLRRYVRATVSLRGKLPVQLPGWVVRWPALLALLDDPRRSLTRSPELAARLGIALMLAEASREGVERFLPHRIRKSLLTSIFGMIAAVGSEAIWRTLRVGYVALVRANPPDRDIRS